MKLGATLFFYQLYLNNAQIIDQNHYVPSPLYTAKNTSAKVETENWKVVRERYLSAKSQISHLVPAFLQNARPTM